MEGSSVVDYGCGTGILAIAACLYGASNVVRDRHACPLFLLITFVASKNKQTSQEPCLAHSGPPKQQLGAPGIGLGIPEGMAECVCVHHCAERSAISCQHEHGDPHGGTHYLRILQVGYDIDAAAVQASCDNAKLNGVSTCCEFHLCTTSALENEHELMPGYSICVANIFLGDLVALRDRLCSLVRPGCPIVLSGILSEQVRRA
jgi:hypothetical protein